MFIWDLWTKRVSIFACESNYNEKLFITKGSYPVQKSSRSVGIFHHQRNITKTIVVNRTTSRNFLFIYILGPIIFKDYFIFHYFYCISLVLKPCELPLLLFILLWTGHCPYLGYVASPRVRIYKGSSNTPCIFSLYYYFVIILPLSLETITAIYLNISHYSINMPSNPSDNL